MVRTRTEIDANRSEQRFVQRGSFSPAQIVAGLIGLVMVVSGVVVAARMGFTPLVGETASIAGIAMTSLMGLAQAVLGLVLLSAATSPLGVRSALIGFGTVALAFGAILIIEPSPFVGALGEARSIGAAYGVGGVVALLGAILSPTITASVSETRKDEERVSQH